MGNKVGDKIFFGAEDEYYDEFEYLKLQYALDHQGEDYGFAIDFYEDTPEPTPPPTPPKTPKQPTPPPTPPTPPPVSPKYVPKIRYYSDAKPFDYD